MKAEPTKTNTARATARTPTEAPLRRHERVTEWFRQLPTATTSAIVCDELSRGIGRLHRGKRRTFLERWLAEILLAMDVVPIDEQTALAAARIETSAERHGLAVATRNIDDMRGLRVMVDDPFRDTRTF